MGKAIVDEFIHKNGDKIDGGLRRSRYWSAQRILRDNLARVSQKKHNPALLHLLRGAEGKEHGCYLVSIYSLKYVPWTSMQVVVNCPKVDFGAVYKTAPGLRKTTTDLQIKYLEDETSSRFLALKEAAPVRREGLLDAEKHQVLASRFGTHASGFVLVIPRLFAALNDCERWYSVDRTLHQRRMATKSKRRREGITITAASVPMRTMARCLQPALGH